jgi:hypothetical protein
MIENGTQRTGSAEFWVADTETNALDAGQDKGPGAHETGLDRGVDRATFEPFIAAHLCGSPQGEHFGMGGGIVPSAGKVVGAGENSVLTSCTRGGDHHRANGHLVGTERGACFFQGEPHKVPIFG